MQSVLKIELDSEQIQKWLSTSNARKTINSETMTIRLYYKGLTFPRRLDQTELLQLLSQFAGPIELTVKRLSNDKATISKTAQLDKVAAMQR